jgi:glutamate N-acetyltransferase / amino-acid N-acetyltransferase
VTRAVGLEGGVTTPRGFRAAGVACGIKRVSNPAAAAPLDLALIVAETPVTAAAVFTTNKAVAAPVTVSRDHLTRSNGRAQAIVVNSGCANACTGQQGLKVARQMAAATAAAVGCTPEQVLVASTGVIGVQLDPDKITRGIGSAAKSLSTDGASAARAIMTTDPFPKSFGVTVTGKGGAFSVGGMAKGSGMIEPRMATMLGFLTTDAQVDAAVLAGALKRVADDTFNAITVDGECSTNDCVFLLASGQSGVRVMRDDDPAFLESLRAVAGHLAREIVRGGEGATKLVTVRVTGAQSGPDAWLAARTIANSPLVKTAIHGGDPNWGRLVAAAGRSGAAFVLDHASVAIGDVPLFVQGTPHDERAEQAAKVLDAPTVTVTVDLGTGGAHDATMWTCDFSAEYVRINAEYRT